MILRNEVTTERCLGRRHWKATACTHTFKLYEVYAPFQILTTVLLLILSLQSSESCTELLHPLADNVCINPSAKHYRSYRDPASPAKYCHRNFQSSLGFTVCSESSNHLIITGVTLHTLQKQEKWDFKEVLAGNWIDNEGNRCGVDVAKNE